MIIDSSVLIDIDQGRGLEKLDKLPDDRHSISSSTYMELATGKYLNETPDSKFEEISKNLQIIPVNQKIADRAGKIMADLIEKGERIEINDIYIAATALEYEEKVLTSNIKHFERIEGLKIVNWNAL